MADMLSQQQVDELRPRLRNLVQHRLGLFALHTSWGRDDLEQYAWERALINLPQYDPSQGASLITFLYQAVSCDLIDLSRKLIRSDRNQAVILGVRQNATVEVEPSPPPESLIDWLGGIVRTARRSIVEQVRRGRHWFSVPNAIGVAALAEHQRLSTRGTADLLACRPDIARAVGLSRPVSHMMVQRSAKFVTEKWPEFRRALWQQRAAEFA